MVFSAIMFDIINSNKCTLYHCPVYCDSSDLNEFDIHIFSSLCLWLVGGCREGFHLLLDILCDDAKNRDISSLFYGMAMKE